MRVQLVCEIVSSNSLLHWNYKNSLHGLFCKLLKEVDKDDIFKNIHDSKQISPYCLSSIDFDRNPIKSDNGLTPRSKTFKFEVSFSNDSLFELFKNINISGILMLNDSFFFRVLELKSLTPVDLEDKIFKSSIILRVKDNLGKQLSRELDDIDYNKAIFNNLIEKYRNISGDTDTVFNIDEYKLDIIKSEGKMENYKKGKLKYHNLMFKLECPMVLKKIAYLNGIGEKNGIGFGYLNIA